MSESEQVAAAVVVTAGDDAAPVTTAATTADAQTMAAEAATATTTSAMPLHDAPQSVVWDDMYSTSTRTMHKTQKQRQQPPQQHAASRVGVEASTATCSHFCRGHDNSHVNRMAAGSYSRYLAIAGELPPHVLHDTFYGCLPTLAYGTNNNNSGGGGGGRRGSNGYNTTTDKSRSAMANSSSSNNSNSGGATVALAHASSTTPACEVRQRVTRYYGRLVRRDSSNNNNNHGGSNGSGTYAHDRTSSTHTAEHGHDNNNNNGDNNNESSTSQRYRGSVKEHAAAVSMMSAAAAAAYDALSSSSQMRVRDDGKMTGTLTHLLRREARVLGPAGSYELAQQRDRRKRDPRHGAGAGRGRSNSNSNSSRGAYVYYNHLSKAYYVPHEPEANTLRLRYDDLYEFGDGTKFATAHGAVDGNAATSLRRSSRLYTRNPRAPPPTVYGDWRALTLPTRPGAAASRTRSHPRDGTEKGGGGGGDDSDALRRPATQYDGGVRDARASMRGAGSTYTSLRTATALDPHTLHCGRGLRTRTLEETLAAHAGCQVQSGYSLRRALVDGKLSEQELPQELRQCCATTTTAAAAAAAASVDDDSNHVAHVVNNSSSKTTAAATTTIALEAPLAFTLRTSAGVRGGVVPRHGVPTTAATVTAAGGAGDSSRSTSNKAATPHGSTAASGEARLPAVHAQPPYTISRLHYKQQYHPSTTPSAFVPSSSS